MPIFEKYELSQEYNLYKDRLPTVNDVLKYVLSRNPKQVEVGNQLFDVLDRDRVVDAVKHGHCFDRAFYIDQLGPRLTVMQVTKVTNEFKCAEENRKRKEAPIYAREESAGGTSVFQFVNMDTDNDEDTITIEERESRDTDFNSLVRI